MTTLEAYYAVSNMTPLIVAILETGMPLANCVTDYDLTVAAGLAVKRRLDAERLIERAMEIQAEVIAVETGLNN